MADIPCRRCGQDQCADPLQVGAPECPRPGCTPDYHRMMENAREAARIEAERRMKESR